MDNNAKKDALLSVMQPASPVLPKSNRPKLELSGTDIRKVKEEGEKRDPVAGKSLREDKEIVDDHLCRRQRQAVPALARCFGRQAGQRLLC